MKKLIIDRATWINGRYVLIKFEKYVDWVNPKFGTSLLMNKVGMSCCLGFLGKECGASESKLLNVLAPTKMDGIPWPDKLFSNNVINTLMLINDLIDIDDNIRETWIAEGFKIGLDYEVEFVGVYPDV